MSIFKRHKESVTIPVKQPVKHEVAHGRWYKLKEAVGITHMGYGDGTNRLPHPNNMGRYAELCTDPTVSVAIDIKRDMVVPDFYFEMPEEDKPKQTPVKGLNPDEEPDGFNKPELKPKAPSGFDKKKVEAFPIPPTPLKPKLQAKPIDDEAPVEPEHPNKKKLEEWKKNTKATKKLKQIVATMISKGFCPVEITNDYNLKVLPPESFFIYRDKTGEVLQYTQEDNMRVLNTWKGAAMDDIILFINDEDTDHPYGEADVESLATLLDTRHELNEDMGKIIKRFSAPFGILRASGSAADVKQNIIDKDIDEILFLGNTAKDEVELMFEEPDPQCKFLPYIDSVDFQIGQKLNAPLILLLKNATEASATKMLDAIDRWVQSTQNEISEILEERIYKKICPTGPTPIHKWGAPKEVLDEITLSDIASLTDKTISKRQAQDLIRKKGIELLEDEEFVNKQPEPSPFGNPFGAPQDKGNNPFQKGNAPFDAKPTLPIPTEKLNDLNLALELIEANLHVNRRQPNIIPETCKRAEEAIRVYMQRVYPDEWQPRYEAMFQQFIHERLGGTATKKQTYTVKVE
jgi:hypothetical protein